MRLLPDKQWPSLLGSEDHWLSYQTEAWVGQGFGRVLEATARQAADDLAAVIRANSTAEQRERGNNRQRD